MMKKTFYQLIAICSVVGLWTGTVMAQDTDTTTTGITLGDWVSEFIVEDRDRNSLGLRPDDYNTADGWLTFNHQDCLDNRTVDFVITLNDIGQDAADGRTLYVYSGENCDSDLTDCTKVTDETNLSTGTVRIDDLEFNDLFNGIDCDAVVTENLEIYLALLANENYYNQDDGDYMTYGGLAILDTVAPSTNVDITDVLVGDDNFEVHFDASPGSSVAGFAVVYAETTSDDCSGGVLVAGEIPDASLEIGTKDSMSTDENGIKVGGLDNDTSYELAVVTIDDAGNPSVLSEVVCATPQESVGIGDALNTDGEFCFVATAAFGSYDHPTVRVLRVFRDEFLRELPLGDAMVAGYYAVGPSLAAWVTPHSETQQIVQSALSLFAGGSTILVQWGALWVLLGLWSALALGLLLGLAAPRVKEK